MRFAFRHGGGAISCLSFGQALACSQGRANGSDRDMWLACDRDFIGVVALRLTSVARNVRWYHEGRLVIAPVIGDM